MALLNLYPDTIKQYFTKNKNIYFLDISQNLGKTWKISYILHQETDLILTKAQFFLEELTNNCHTVYITSMGGELKELIALMNLVIIWAYDSNYTKFYFADNTKDKSIPKVKLREHFKFKKIGKDFTSRRTNRIISEYQADIPTLYDKLINT